MPELAPRPAQILLVEDNPGDVLLTKKSLSRWPVNSVVVAMSGEEALEILDSSSPDLVLLDLNLPGISGLDLLMKIRSSDKSRLIPVVVLTSSEAEIDILTSYESHANGYLVKPPTVEQLNSLVDVVVGHWFAFGRAPQPHWSRIP